MTRFSRDPNRVFTVQLKVAKKRARRQISLLVSATVTEFLHGLEPLLCAELRVSVTPFGNRTSSMRTHGVA